MFEKASKLKLRFDTVRGFVSTEDLWDVPLTSTRGFDLDTIAKAVNKQLKESEEESFVRIKTAASNVATLKLDILKHIIAAKIETNQNKQDAQLKAEKKQKILEIIAKKQDSSLEEKSIDELKAELESL